MPLIQSDSDEALKKNIRTEIKAGRDPKQAVAIALDIQRRAKAKKKKSKHALKTAEEKLAEIDFDSIKESLQNAKPEKDEDGIDNRYVTIGTIQDLAPSGKYFICWTTDHGNPEIDEDVKFWNGFEEKLEEFGFPAWLENDGDSIKVAAHMEIDQERHLFDECPDCGKPMDECICEEDFSFFLKKNFFEENDLDNIFEMTEWGKKTGRSTPAPAKDRIKGSDTNKPGSAKSPGGEIEIDEKTETGLKNKVQDHNEQMKKLNKPDWSKATLGQVKAVYRRGAGAYSTSHRPGVTRGAWAMARVNAYLHLLKHGRPENKKYVTDNDLLPKDHPKSTRTN